MAYIGRLINVGLGVESTRGTAVVPEAWIPKTDFTFEDKTENIQNEASVGVIADNIGSALVKKWAEGEISGNVGINTFGYLLLSAFGQVYTTGDFGSYTHQFDVSNNNAHKSLTIGMTDPVLGSKKFPLAMMDELTISAEEGGFATFSSTFKSKPSESEPAPFTRTYVPERTMLARTMKAYIASDYGTLVATPTQITACLKSFEITISKNLEDQFCMGSLTPSDFSNTSLGIEGSFTATFESAFWKDVAERNLDAGFRAMRFVFQFDGEANALTIDLPMAFVTEFTRSMGNDETVTQTVTFKASHSLTNGFTARAILTNGFNGYPQVVAPPVSYANVITLGNFVSETAEMGVPPTSWDYVLTLAGDTWPLDFYYFDGINYVPVSTVGSYQSYQTSFGDPNTAHRLLFGDQADAEMVLGSIYVQQ